MRKPIPIRVPAEKLEEILNSRASNFKKAKKLLQYLRQEGRTRYFIPATPLERELCELLATKSWMIEMENLGFEGSGFVVTKTGEKVHDDLRVMLESDEPDAD